MTRFFSSLLKKYDEEKHGQHQKDIFPNIVHPFSIFTFIKQNVKQGEIFVMQDSLAMAWSSFFSFSLFLFPLFHFLVTQTRSPSRPSVAVAGCRPHDGSPTLAGALLCPRLSPQTCTSDAIIILVNVVIWQLLDHHHHRHPIQIELFFNVSALS